MDQMRRGSRTANRHRSGQGRPPPRKPPRQLPRWRIWLKRILVWGSAVAALGLTEAQLIEADLVTADGTDLGDVEQVRRGADGMVEGLLVSIEDSDPDRYVVVPLAGLTTRLRGGDTDLQTTMIAQDLAALPDASLDAGAAEPAATPAP